MFQPPLDKPDECNARLFLGDDYGDRSCTIRCQLPVGHDGDHREDFGRGVVTWATDERYHCEKHGIQPEDYCEICFDEETAWWDGRCDHDVMPRSDCEICVGHH